MSNSVTFQFENRADLEARMRNFLSEPAVAYPVAVGGEGTDPVVSGEPTREDYKAKLDSLGVKYNNRLGLESLKALVAAQEVERPLADSGAGSGGQGPDPEDMTGEVPGPAPEPEDDLFAGDAPKEITKEELRSELETFVNKIGAEGQAKAFAILKEVAGVSRLADLPVEKYADVVARLKV